MMRKEFVRTPEEALAHMVDCTLATVCDLASKKSKSKTEYERQISIAQAGVDWMRAMGIRKEGTRAADLPASGSVTEWANQWEPKSAAAPRPRKFKVRSMAHPVYGGWVARAYSAGLRVSSAQEPFGAEKFVVKALKRNSAAVVFQMRRNSEATLHLESPSEDQVAIAAKLVDLGVLKPTAAP